MSDEATQTPAIDFEAMFQGQVDADAVKKTAADALFPAGTYVPNPPLTMRPMVTDDGRPLVSYFGRFVKQPKEGETEEVVASFRYSVSHVRKDRVEYVDGVRTDKSTGKPDSPSLLWAQAVMAFTKLAERAPESVGEVYQFLRDQRYGVRLIQIGTSENAKGEPGNMVVSLYPLRDQG